MTINVPSKPGNSTSDNVGSTRDKMTFTDEYHINDGTHDWTLRLYKSRGGAYGPQYRAILWCHGPGVVSGPWVGRMTHGCGFCKPSAAIGSVMAVAGYKYDEGRGAGGLHEALGCDVYAIHHAHG